MIRYRELIVLQSTAIIIGFLIITNSNAEEECLTGKSYMCYECDSWSDSRCKDPFNWTALPKDLPQPEPCEGCCVKIVMNAKQPNEEIRRTCTKKMRINLFMVDHVCMYEGHKTGHMCFCEGDTCNDGPRVTMPMPTAFIMTIATLLVARYLKI